MGVPAPALAARRFRALGADIELLAPTGAARRLERAERWLHAYERRLSRFLPTSELSRLNRQAGRPVRVSPLLFRLASLALDFARRTEGTFDPTVLGALEAVGYDRDFEALAAAPVARAGPAGRHGEVRLDAARRTVTLPEGVGLDLGGVGKGWAVDRLAALLGAPTLVNAGGDVFAAGAPPDARHWLVGVADPFEPARDVALLALTDAGVATSSVLRRRWGPEGATRHHLIDARAGAPSRTDVVAATVVAPTATLADVHAKVALLLGSRDGLRHFERQEGVEGLLFSGDRVIFSRGIRRYLSGAMA